MPSPAQDGQHLGHHPVLDLHQPSVPGPGAWSITRRLQAKPEVQVTNECLRLGPQNPVSAASARSAGAYRSGVSKCHDMDWSSPRKQDRSRAALRWNTGHGQGPHRGRWQTSRRFRAGSRSKDDRR
jgi:hypothetical protein